MSEAVIEYKSDWKFIDSNAKVLETKSQNGITCTWSGQLVNGANSLKHSWEFDWYGLIKRGIDELHGHIIVRRPISTGAENVRIDFKLTENCRSIKKIIGNVEREGDRGIQNPTAAFDYYLTPIYSEEVFYEEMFAASEKTDGVLVVEEKKFHVNKAFLSFHSDFFFGLFSSNFKEGQLTEIPIENVSCKHFGLLLSTIHPNTVFPNDRTAEKLLELADRFLMPSVTAHVEYHLLNNSNISEGKLMWMADAYKMKKVFEKSLRALDTVEKIKAVWTSGDYGKLSDEAKLKVSEKLIQMV